MNPHSLTMLFKASKTISEVFKDKILLIVNNSLIQPLKILGHTHTRTVCLVLYLSLIVFLTHYTADLPLRH